MKVTIKLGNRVDSHKVEVFCQESWRISRLISEIRLQLSPPIPKTLHLAELSGSEVFLSLTPDGPRLDEAKALDDYQLNNDCVLWLMCAHKDT